MPFKRTDILHSIATIPGLDPAHPLVANNQETGGAALQWLREQIIAPHDGLHGGGSGIGREGMAPERLSPVLRGPARASRRRRRAGSEGLLFMPWLNGERSPFEDKYLRGGWLNLSLRTDRAMLVRSVLEGVAYNVRWLFERVREVPQAAGAVRCASSAAARRATCGARSTPTCWASRWSRWPTRATPSCAAWRCGHGSAWASWHSTDVPALVPVAAALRARPDAAAYVDGFAEYRKLAGSLKGLYHRLHA